jgi:hypothetical protein
MLRTLGLSAGVDYGLRNVRCFLEAVGSMHYILATPRGAAATQPPKALTPSRGLAARS